MSELEARLDKLLATAQAETAHIDIFTPIAEREECQICMLPLPLNKDEILFMPCCGKQICLGCMWQSNKADIAKGVPLKKQKCAFCRQLLPTNSIKAIKKLMKKKNNPHAYMEMAGYYNRGEQVLQSDTKCLEMFICAAELGNADAIGWIGQHYQRGNVVEQEHQKALAFWEIASKKGDIASHDILARVYENVNENKSIKHFKVAASAGDQVSMDNLMKLYKDKSLSKEELTQTLRAFQASTNEMKSKDRDEARVLFHES